jgi:hypothetical protein
VKYALKIHFKNKKISKNREKNRNLKELPKRCFSLPLLWNVLSLGNEVLTCSTIRLERKNKYSFFELFFY